MNGVFTQPGGRNDIRYLRYGHEFRKFASARQRFDAPNRIDNLIDVLLTQDRLHQPRRFLFHFVRAHRIFRTTAAVDDVFAQRLPVLQSDFNQSLKAVLRPTELYLSGPRRAGFESARNHAPSRK